MINRFAIKSLERLSSQFPIVTITGPRQSGKTTLAKMAFKNKKYVTLDDTSIREIANNNPKDFLNAFPDGAIIDEIQKAPVLFDELKIIVDNDFTPGKYILTGSNNFKIKNQMTESLAGRVGNIKLLPFTIEELFDANIQYNDCYDYIIKGMYPPLYDDRKKFIKEDWFENYIEHYLNLDIRELINQSNTSLFKTFIKICAEYSGNIFSMDAISRDIGVSSPTIKQWLSILENSYIIYLLPADRKNLGTSLTKSPKLYFLDTGLLCYLLNIATKEDLLLSRKKGAVVETFVISEILKYDFNDNNKSDLMFYHDANDLEVDVITNWKHNYAIEIKSDSNPNEKYIKKLEKYIEKRKNDNTKSAIFYLGDLTTKINSTDFVSWKDFAHFIKNNK